MLLQLGCLETFAGYEHAKPLTCGPSNEIGSFVYVVTVETAPIRFDRQPLL